MMTPHMHADFDNCAHRQTDHFMIATKAEALVDIPVEFPVQLQTLFFFNTDYNNINCCIRGNL